MDERAGDRILPSPLSHSVTQTSSSDVPSEQTPGHSPEHTPVGDKDAYPEYQDDSPSVSDEDDVRRQLTASALDNNTRDTPSGLRPDEIALIDQELDGGDSADDLQRMESGA